MEAVTASRSRVDFITIFTPIQCISSRWNGPARRTGFDGIRFGRMSICSRDIRCLVAGILDHETLGMDEFLSLCI